MMSTRTESHKFPWALVALAFGFTWLILLPGVLASFGWIDIPLPGVALIALGQFGPLLAAFILAWRSQGRSGAWQLLRRAFNWRVGWRGYLILTAFYVLAAAIVTIRWGAPHRALQAARPQAFAGRIRRSS